MDTVWTLYLYDVCYALFQPGSSAYDLRNEVEIEINGASSSADAARLGTHGDMLLPLPQLLLDLAGSFHRTVIVPLHEEVTVGENRLRHLAFHYHHLPDILLFLHTDVLEHVPQILLKRVLDAVSLRQWPPEVSHLHLGDRHHGPVDASGRVGSEVFRYCTERRDRVGGSCSTFRGCYQLKRNSVVNRGPDCCKWIEHVWEMLFGTPMQLPGDDFGSYDFDQFAVSREAVQRRPQSFWAQLGVC